VRPLQLDMDYEQRLPPSAQLGMARADEHAKAEWKRVVDDSIMNVALEQAEFTVDDVLAKLGALPFPPKTHNDSALGPRMKEVAKR
jgi:hypothetical protein